MVFKEEGEVIEEEGIFTLKEKEKMISNDSQGLFLLYLSFQSYSSIII